MNVAMKAPKRIRVLIVEDDPASRQYLLLLLKKLGIEAVVTATGEAALEAVKDKTVDGMLLDIALGPGMSGLELGERLKQDERFKDKPMLAVTAFWQEVLDKLPQKGFDEFIGKPYTFDQLKEVLARYSLLANC